MAKRKRLKLKEPFISIGRIGDKKTSGEFVKNLQRLKNLFIVGNFIPFLYCV